MYSPPRGLPPSWEPWNPPRSSKRQVEVVYHVLVFLVCSAWTLVTSIAKTPVRPALTMKANRTQPSLDGDPGPSGEAPRRPLNVRSMLADWRWVWTEVGTCLMVACVSESMYQMGSHSIGRAVHIHLALGFSKGFALMLIWVIIVAQAAASVALLVPTIYFVTGAIAPSATLAGTLWFEALVFGDVTDPLSTVRSVALTLTAVMLALFRFDRQARNAMEQLPTSGVLLSIEARVRKASTAARTGLVCPCVGTCLLCWALYQNPYWRSHGISYEWQRGKFHAAAATSALLFLTAGQDTKAHVVLGDRLERLYDKMMKRKEELLGEPRGERPLGSKKAL